MMITWVMRGGGRTVPGCGPVIATTLLRGPLPANTPLPLRDEALVDLIRIKMGWPREVFEPVVRPVIDGYAAYVQGLPATESQPHAAAGARLTHALQVGSRALDFRRGQILPRGAAPEAIGAQAHRWTYAVFVAALLHDERHDGLAVQFLNCLVPPLILEWLAADGGLMRELAAFLAEDDSAPAGAIGEMVWRAAGQAPSRDLCRCGGVDPNVKEAALAVNPAGVKAENNVENPAVTSTTTVAMDQSALPDEEAEYLEDVDADQPDAAGRFMAWLQQGLADGALPVNVAGALVHFVPEGMLLVSPRIFRVFATRFGEDGHGPASAAGDPDIGKSIQRQFLRAGWHLPAGKGVNILSYQVMRGERAVSLLSGVVIPNPESFIAQVPAVNPVLVRLPAKAGEV